MTSREQQVPAALPGGPRPIRRVEPPTTPWPGILAADEDGCTCVLVDTAELVGWPGWCLTDAAHVAAPRDLIRTPTGHQAVLPFLNMPMAEFFERRERARTPLSDAETVTLAVSLVRGAATVYGCLGEEPVCGRWWLAEDGRPVFVCEPGQPEVAAGAAAWLDRVMRTRDGAGADHIVVAVGRVRHLLAGRELTPADVEGAEQELFRAARPEPLATTLCTPIAARDLSVVDAEPTDDDHRERWWTRLAPEIDRPLKELIGQATTAVWRRGRAQHRSGRRARPLVLAAAVAAAVLAVGLAWPTGTDADAHEGGASRSSAGRSGPSSERTQAPESASPTSPGPEASASASSSPQKAVQAVLELWRGCDDAPCRALTQVDPSADLPDGAASDPRAQLHLIDDYGGAAVFRAHVDGAGPDQIVVIVREDGRWLLRRVRDAAAGS